MTPPAPRDGFDADELAPGEWEEPVPLPGSAATGVLHPNWLGGTTGAFVEAVAEETGTPPDLAALAVLGTTSTLIAGAVVVEGTTGATGWLEPVNLYLACLAAPGEGKTPVMKRCASVLYSIELERQERRGSRDPQC